MTQTEALRWSRRGHQRLRLSWVWALGVVACLLWPVDRATAAEEPLSGPTLQLLQAVEVNDLPGVKAAIRNGADLEAKNALGKTAADVAVDKGHFIIAHYLLSQRSAAREKTAAKSAAKSAQPRRLSPRPKSSPPAAKKPAAQTAKRRSASPPKRSAASRPRKTVSTKPVVKFGLPPRKPPAPIPEATDIAAAPGLQESGGQGDGDDLFPEIDEDRPESEVAETPAEAPPEEAGPVGKFFKTLLDLVRPDEPAPTRVAEPKSRPAAEPPSQPTRAPRPAGRVPLPAEPEDKEDPDSDLTELIEDAGETDGDADKDLDTAPDDGLGELNDLDELEKLADTDPETEGEVEDAPRVRRVGPSQPGVQTARPVPVKPKPKKPEDSSTASRTLDRLQGLVGEEKPEEDEFGLPVIELKDETPVVQDDDNLDSLLAQLDGDGPSDTSALDDIDSGERPSSPGRPRSAARTPVQALPSPREGSPRFQETLQRLRRLGEAVSRDVRPDPNSILSEGRRTGYRRLPDPASDPSSPASGDRSRLPMVDKKVDERETSTSRLISRLERIRRDAYEESKPPKPMAKPQRPIGQAADPPPTSETEGEEPGVVSALARFFKSGDDRSEGEDPRVLDQAYRTGQNQGRAADKDGDTRSGSLSEQALEETAAEPAPGQKAGTMAPGILDNLSRLFTDQKVADESWSADVEVNDPNAKDPPSAAPISDSTPTPAAAADAEGGAWTTTVELNTETGDPLVLGVSKTPVPGDTPPQTQVAAADPAKDARLQELLKQKQRLEELNRLAAAPPPEPGQPDPLAGLTDAPDSALPPAEPAPAPTSDDPLGDLPDASANGDPLGDLPAADGDPLGDLPSADGDATGDLPPAEGDPLGDLPPAEGEAGDPTADSLGDLPPAEGDPPDAAAKAAAPPRIKRAPPKQLPYSDPLRAPEPQPRTAPAGAPKTSLSRVAQLKPGPEDPALRRDKLRLSRDEKLAGSERRFPTPGEVAAAQQKQAPAWPVTKLAKNDSQPPRSRRVQPAMLSRTSLTGVSFTLGESVSLENSFPPGDGIDADNQCVKKNRGTTLFCVEPVDWPETLRTKFVVPTILYTGPMAIVRYDQGSASRLHALFPSNEFEAVVKFYQERYGEPTEIWKRSIAPLAEPRRDNPTIAWRSRDPKTNAITILELRQFDDTRGGFPDTSRGAVMLYLANSPAIFPQVSSHELMRLKREGEKQPG